MPIYVKDETATKLLDEVVALSGAPSKTAAIIDALREKKETLEAKTSFADRVAPLQAQMRALGKKDTSFDMKAFSDEMSGE